MESEYTLDSVKKKVSDCLDGKISMKDLASWSFKFWYFYMEGGGKEIEFDRKSELLKLVLDIDAQWDLVFSKGTSLSTKQYLKEKLWKLEKLTEEKKK